MDPNEQSSIQSEMRENKQFLREVWKKSHSLFKLRKTLSLATLKNLRALLAILRAISKGSIPIASEHKADVKKTRALKKLVALSDETHYRKVSIFDRSELSHFLEPFTRTWKIYLIPVFHKKYKYNKH